jgi:hypothetical protein
VAWRVVVTGLTVASCAEKGYYYNLATADRDGAEGSGGGRHDLLGDHP